MIFLFVACSFIVTDFWCCYGNSLHLPRAACWATPVGEYTLITQQCPTTPASDSLTTSEISTSAHHHLRLSSCSFTMSNPFPRTMQPTQQWSLTRRPPIHCPAWQPGCPEYVYFQIRPTPQRKSHSTIHRAQPNRARNRCTQRPNSAPAWHTRRRSLSRLELVNHTTHHISNTTMLGNVQVVPVLYRRHLARIIIRIGTGEMRRS